MSRPGEAGKVVGIFHMVVDRSAGDLGKQFSGFHELLLLDIQIDLLLLQYGLGPCDRLLRTGNLNFWNGARNGPI